MAALSLHSGATSSTSRCRRSRRSAYWSGDAVPQLEGVRRPFELLRACERFKTAHQAVKHLFFWHEVQRPAKLDACASPDTLHANAHRCRRSCIKADCQHLYSTIPVVLLPPVTIVRSH